MTNISLLPIDSALARMRHAEEYLDTIQDKVKSWMNENPYGIVRQTNSDYTRYSVILRINKEPLLQEWSLVSADIIHNLRCALDNLVYAIAIHESGKEIPPSANKLMFPICDGSAQFREQEGRRLKTLSIPVRSAIEALQPYNRPHEFLFPLLSILRDFDDFNKHRLLRVAFSAVARGNIGFCGPHPITVDNFQVILNHGELKDGAEIAAIVFNSPTPDMKFDRLIFAVMLAFWNKPQHPLTSFDERIDFMALLKLLSNEVKAVFDIIAKSVFNQSFQRLGQ